MKKLSILFLALILGVGCFAQKKNGTVYSEHELIDKAKLFWTSVLDDNLENLKSITADSVYINSNGNPGTMKNENWGTWITYWNGFEDAKVEDDGAAYPDAIEYDGGVNWVQDWLRITGIHKETGINVDLHIHNLYNFNEEGKIVSIAFYFSNDVFEKINDNLITSENGTIYKSHPYITATRKFINAYATMDVNSWESFFAPNAQFRNSTMKAKTMIDMNGYQELIKGWTNDIKELKFQEFGFPDCIHYNHSDAWVVWSWWIVTQINNDGTKIEFPLQFSHTFNKEGKISIQGACYSTNHFE